MAITLQQIRELRDTTGVGIMECKEALNEAEGNMDAAIKLLRKKGLAEAGRRAGREASEGLVASYIHAGGKIGVLVEVNCESDFVAETSEFQDFVKDISMQIAAARPTYLRKDDVDEEVLEEERDIYRSQVKDSGKPEHIIEKIVDGKLEKFYAENCLYQQSFIKDQSMTIEELVGSKVAEFGENVQIRRFARFQLGEDSLER